VLLSPILAVILAILFIVKENLSYLMVIFDSWSPLFAVLFLLEVIVTIIGFTGTTFETTDELR
jgi:hypothetical protein